MQIDRTLPKIFHRDSHGVTQQTVVTSGHDERKQCAGVSLQITQFTTRHYKNNNLQVMNNTAS